MCYKILHNLVNVDCVNFFQRSTPYSLPEKMLLNLINHELSPLVAVISSLTAYKLNSLPTALLLTQLYYF